MFTEKMKEHFECKFDYRAKINTEDVDNYCQINNIKQDKTSSTYFWDYLKFENEAKKELIENLRVEIKNTISKAIIQESQYSIKLLIPKNDFSKFFKYFIENNFIDWSHIATLKDLPWSKEIIESGKNFWNWELLQSYSIIEWTFNDLENYKDLINWSFIPDLKLKWDIKNIYQFIEYLNFKVAPSRSSINYQEYLHKNKGAYDCFSAKEDLEWDDKLIIEFYNNWDWFYLSCNNGINWTMERIEKFEQTINFSSLSHNKSINWNYGLIKKYSTKLNFLNLVTNNSVYWTLELFEEYFDEINIYHFAKSANIDSSIIIKFKNIWKEEHKNKVYNRKTYETYTLHSLWEYLSKNKNLIWNDSLIDNCINEMSFNKISDNNIQLSVSTINKYWDFKKTERVYYRFKDWDITERFEEIYFRDVIKNATIIDLTINDYESNKEKWSGVLICNEFTNKSIKELINN